MPLEKEKNRAELNISSSSLTSLPNFPPSLSLSASNPLSYAYPMCFIGPPRVCQLCALHQPHFCFDTHDINILVGKIKHISLTPHSDCNQCIRSADTVWTWFWFIFIKNTCQQIRPCTLQINCLLEKEQLYFFFLLRVPCTV